MNTGFKHYLSYLSCQMQDSTHPTQFIRRLGHRPLVTISRQSGTGGAIIAEHLVGFLKRKDTAAECPWTIFDRNIVEKVIEDHHLPKELAKYMPEDQPSFLADAMEEILGLHPSSETLVQKSTETLYQLALLGHCVLMGRGANLIAAKLGLAIHVRLVGSLPKRIAHIQETQKLDAKAAAAFVQAEDEGRKRYLKHAFNRDIDDPLLYHLILNTDWVSYEESARIIGQMVLDKTQSC